MSRRAEIQTKNLWLPVMLILLMSVSALAETLTGKVVGVADGDTIPANTDVGGLRALLRPAEAGNMTAYPVCRAVNSARSDSPTFVEPV